MKIVRNAPSKLCHEHTVACGADSIENTVDADSTLIQRAES